MKNPDNLPDVNRLAVLKSISQDAPFTRMDIVRKVNLSLPTVGNILTGLVDDGYVLEIGNGESRGGRPPTLYRLNPRARFAIGVEFRLPKLVIGLVDFQNNLIALDEYPFEEDIDRAAITVTLLDGIAKLLAEQQLSTDKLVGIGLGIPGFVDSETGVWLRYPRVPSVRDVPIRAPLAERFDVPIFIQNEANVYASAELRYGLSPVQNDALFITWSEGVKASVYIDGAIVSGRYGNFGAIGHFSVVENGRPCYCGSKGCLEMYASGYAFRDAIQAAVDSVRPGLQPVDIFPLAETGDLFSRRIVAEAVPYLASALASLIRLTDISQIILLGTFARGGDYLLTQLYESVAGRLPGIVRSNLTMRLGSQYAMETIVRAAAAPALERYFEV